MEEILDLEDMPLSITPYEDIAACAMAMDCIADMEEALMSREEAVLIQEIRVRVLKIVHTGIKEIYDSNFYG